MSVENAADSGTKPGGRGPAPVVMMGVLTLLLVACGAQSSDGVSDDPGEQRPTSESADRSDTDGAEEATAERTTGAGSGEAAQLARAEVGKR